MASSKSTDYRLAVFSRSQVDSSDAVKELETAIARFQAILNDDDRKKLQELKTTSHDSQSIILFTAELDRLDAELKTYVEDIRSKAEHVQRDIELVKAQYDREEQQLQTRERQVASDHRRNLFAWTSKATAEMRMLQLRGRKVDTDQRRYRLLQELSSYNFAAALNIIRTKRHLGTAQWIFETQEFKEWMVLNNSAFLHVTGKIGSGKSVLASSVVDKLFENRPPQQFTSFFFLRFDDPSSLDPHTIIRSCLQQLLSAIPMADLRPGLASDIDDCLERNKELNFALPSLRQLYYHASEAVDTWFIILDGLDEFAPNQQSTLLDFLSRVIDTLPESRSIKILFSSRETSSNAIQRAFPNCPQLMTGGQCTSDDISAFVEDILKEKVKAYELVVSDPRLLDEIRETIDSKKQGMFLWAFLTIEDMCSRKTDKEIRQALQEIPTDLPATFDRALSRIVEKQNQDIAKKAFMWTRAAIQPLTLAQIREALSIEINQRTLHQDDLISGIDRLPTWCESLVYVEETDNTVHFSHHSIREYLLTPGSGKFFNLHIEDASCNQLAGEACITYLNLDNFQTALVQNHSQNGLKLDVGEMAGQTVQDAVRGSLGTRMGRLVRNVVKSQQHTGGSINQSVVPNLFPRGIANFEFLKYASQNWFMHAVRLDSKADATTWRNLGQLIKNPPPQAKYQPWTDDSWRVKVKEILDSDAGPLSAFYKSVLLSLSQDDSRDPFTTDLYFAFIHADYHLNWGLSSPSCDCAKEPRYQLQEDVCQLIQRGYYRALQPHIHALAVLSRQIEGAIRVTSLSTLINSCEIDANTLINSKTITGKTLFDILVEGALSNFDTFKASGYSKHPHGYVVSHGQDKRTREFFEYWDHIAVGSSWQTRLESSIALIGLLQAGREGSFAAVLQNFQHLDSSGGLVPLHRRTIARVFNEAIVPTTWPYSVVIRAVTSFFEHLDHLGLGDIQEDIFKRSVWRNNWSLATALLSIRPVSADARIYGDLRHIRSALRCESCQRLNFGDYWKGELIDESSTCFKLCPFHLQLIKKRTNEDLLLIQKDALQCPNGANEKDDWRKTMIGGFVSAAS
ncbi:Vegetative incompatibility protein HET-E-1 [Fusarium odoratissimum]|uniref:Vegetative incompatibility protein HET-E-1 n=1 Tax=Fusarium oxysporum f. sp. cubense (strain race 4) TaxID=2502994 RepID=N1RBD9_FUSC4|nr:Vegetative incompatibility protein HET-E-1 [Fusarium odoratissimum]